MLRSTSRILIATSAAFILAIAMYALLWFLIGQKLERASAAHVIRAQSLARSLEISNLEKTLAETEADRERLKDFVVTDESLTEFLALVEGAVRSQGLKATTRAVEIEAGDGGRFEQLALTIAADGDYESQKRLIVLLETMPFRIDLRSVRLDRGVGSDWSGVYTFAVTKERTP